MKSKQNLPQFEQKIGFKFKNKNLLRQVFVHRSYLNENKELGLAHNERLEFLGDAVIELSVTEYLYRHYPNPEGELTNWRAALVRGEMLAVIAKDLGMEDFLLLSKGERKAGGKSRMIILANIFEALIGAIYLEGGLKDAGKLVEKLLLKKLPRIIEKKLYQEPKSSLQELTQGSQGLTPHYRVLEETGPDHAKRFLVGVYLGEKLLAEGCGLSKQNAEQEAAEKALKKLQTE